ncbi:MAG TPA: alkaline phosphatase family protein [Candidatus Cybelea sp.]|nr:alkaline phosphatase family protein [Candidatus Cybelea sp.]
MRFQPLLFVLVSSGLVLTSACSSSNGSPSLAQQVLPLAAGHRNSGSVGLYIKHVVVIVQENRTFENFFAGYPGANAPMYGYGKDASGKRIKIPLSVVTMEKSPNLPHSFVAGLRMWDNGQMDGFSKYGRAGYSYVQRGEIAPYWQMAKQYVLADDMFPTEIGPSYTAHLTLIAGTDNLSPTKAEVDFPSAAPQDCDSKPGTTSSFVDEYQIVHWRLGPFPCFTQFKTMADTLDAANVSWKYYVTKLMNAGIWAPFEAIYDVRYGPDWPKDIGAPPYTVLDDIKNGDLANVVWVTPTKIDSDHPGSAGDRGPSWVGAIVNAIGESKYWDSTAIVVVWDDWGGLYDNAPPPQLDFRGLGIRIPCLIVSPYAKKGYVSHTQYEFGSILKFIEQAFSLPPLGATSDGYTDVRANSLIDSFDFRAPPRAFIPIPTKYKIKDYLKEPKSWIDEPVDDE